VVAVAGSVVDVEEDAVVLVVLLVGGGAPAAAVQVKSPAVVAAARVNWKFQKLLLSSEPSGLEQAMPTFQVPGSRSFPVPKSPTYGDQLNWGSVSTTPDETPVASLL
jgi:hypothetical protein